MKRRWSYLRLNSSETGVKFDEVSGVEAGQREAALSFFPCDVREPHLVRRLPNAAYNPRICVPKTILQPFRQVCIGQYSSGGLKGASLVF